MGSEFSCQRTFQSKKSAPFSEYAPAPFVRRVDLRGAPAAPLEEGPPLLGVLDRQRHDVDRRRAPAQARLGPLKSQIAESVGEKAEDEVLSAAHGHLRARVHGRPDAHGAIKIERMILHAELRLERECVRPGRRLLRARAPAAPAHGRDYRLRRRRQILVEARNGDKNCPSTRRAGA